MQTFKQLDLSNPMPVCISHGQLIVFDQDETEPGSLWTDAHVAQGFVRRDYALGIGTLISFGSARVRLFLGRPESLSRYERVVSVPLVLSSGILCIEGPDEHPANRSVKVAPGAYKVICCQVKVAEFDLEIDIFLSPLTSPITRSEILKADDDLCVEGALLETGEVA